MPILTKHQNVSSLEPCILSLDPLTIPKNSLRSHPSNETSTRNVRILAVPRMSKHRTEMGSALF